MPDSKSRKHKQRIVKSLDGIVSQEGFHGRGNIDFDQAGQSHTAAGAIADFKRSEGFHSAYQPVIDSPAAEDIIIELPDDKSQKKAKKPSRSLFSRVPILGKLSRSARGKKPWSRRKKILLSLASLIVLAGAFFGLKIYFNAHKIFSGGGGAPGLNQCQDLSQLHKEGDCRINVLILGIGGPGHDGANLTDTILLASIDPINYKVDLLSLPRDMWVQIPGYGYRRINEAYFYGREYSKAKGAADRKRDGLKMVDQTIAPILGIPVHYHAVVDFTAFKQTVDAVGGVTVNVPERLYDPSVAWENNYNPVIAEKGQQKFNGALALLYAKSRKADNDFARSERQRLILVALKDKVLSLGTFANPVKVSSLLSSLGNNVFTDFSLHDSSKIYEIISKVESSNIKSLDLLTPPHDLLTTANLDGLSVVQPKAGLFSYGAIQAYIHKTLRDGLLAKEDAAIAIYNATSTAGLAANKASELKSYGYRINKVNNATRTPDLASTILVDLSKKDNKYTKHYLELRLRTKATSDLPDEYGIVPPEGTDFVIILGTR